MMWIHVHATQPANKMKSHTTRCCSRRALPLWNGSISCHIQKGGHSHLWFRPSKCSLLSPEGLKRENDAPRQLRCIWKERAQWAQMLASSHRCKLLVTAGFPELTVIFDVQTIYLSGTNFYITWLLSPSPPWSSFSGLLERLPPRLEVLKIPTE